MTISIWRYSHLVLAVSCFIFLAIASLTGIILGVDAAMSPTPKYVNTHIDTITLNTLIPRLQANYIELNSLQVEDHQYIAIKGLDNDGKEANDYIDPNNGKKVASHKDKSPFIQSVTSFHRSLFLHETGRFFIGLSSFLLVLITVSGIALVLKQQKGLRRFFASFSKEYFSQYYHVLLGRLSLIPILIISVSGTYLSLVKFNILPEKKMELKTPAHATEEKQVNIADFVSFKEIKLKDLRSIDFPFADDPEEYFKIKLSDRELLVNQFSGKIVAEQKYPMVNIINTISLNLHTGKNSIIWAILLTIASINILFFIYSGFVITLKRRRNKIQNKYKTSEAEYILLVGSENGSTIHFANSIMKQLINHGKKVYLAELNTFDLDSYPHIKQLIIFSATFGLGDAPTNANKFLGKLEDTEFPQDLEYCIVGFGSTNYPDFCGYANRISEMMETKAWAKPILPLYRVNDRSLSDFAAWVSAWSDLIHLPLITTPNYYADLSHRKLYSFTVTQHSETNELDKNFQLTLEPNKKMRFHSGDLFAIYPENNEKERLYSIGKVGKSVQLVVKLHENGLGSTYLHQLKLGDRIEAAIQYNHGFHLEKKQPPTIFVSNGTGIAPFLGMLQENDAHIPITMYAGFRKKEPLQLTIQSSLSAFQKEGKLKAFTIAFSREENHSDKYVYELIEKDIVTITEILDKGGVMMICGAIAMHKEVVSKLKQYCANFETYQMQNQIRSDCY